MSSTKSIKQRIKSVKNTSQITKAMEVVSATKMRKSQAWALGARPYAVASLEMLKNLLARTPPHSLSANSLLSFAQPTKSEGKNSALLVVTSDKGLAGAFNSNIIKKAENWIKEKKQSHASYTLVTVGKKAHDYFERRKEPIQKSFWGFGDYSSLKDTLPVAKTIMEGFLYGTYDEAWGVYTNFRTTLVQDAVLKKILPVTKEGIEEAVAGILPEHGRFANQRESTRLISENQLYNYEYKFEPSPAEILEALVPQLIRMHVHHIILESNASEHSARMVAMKNASDNAKDLIGNLTLEYNKSRQAGITRELTEITAGKEALEN